jgi:hypothetical protein
MAFKFYPKGFTPKYQVRSQAIRNIPNDDLEVPPNTVVRTDGYFRLARPARIDAFQPHMHMRGKGLTVEAIDPTTNRTQVLSSVDHFRLQLAHQLRVCRRCGAAAPGGDGAALDRLARQHVGQPPQSRSEHVGRFGERSVDDMLQVWLNIVYLDDAEYQRLVEERKARPTSSSSAQQNIQR